MSKSTEELRSKLHFKQKEENGLQGFYVLTK